MEVGYQNIRMIFVVPIFLGVLLSLVICVYAGKSYGMFVKPDSEAVKDAYEDAASLFSASENITDTVLEFYRNPEFSNWVLEFFTGLCSNRDIAHAILDSSDEFNVPPALAFALCWEESRFNPYAVNRQNRNGTIDRGLFQLNSRSFPHLDTSSFFIIAINARYGVGYLRQCLDNGGTEISALAMYNAGAGRVRSLGAPQVTLDYISRILENRRKIESRFHTRLIREEEARLAERSFGGNITPGGLFGTMSF